MRFPQNRHVLAIVGVAVLSLTACASYTPTPVADTSVTEPAGVEVESNEAAAAEAEPEPSDAGAAAADPEPEPEPAGSATADSEPEPAGSPTAEPGTDPEPAGSGTAEPEPDPSGGAGADTGTVQTKWGPLTETDRKLITGVRLAGLWEMPLAQDAVQRASTPRVRQISREIASQHHTLDKLVRDTAAKLKVKLPVKPTDEQQDWMSDISSRSGKAYDTTYVKWLRLAHGKVFALIGTVRGSTQNTEVRRFAEQCNTFVLNHQRLLESTGLTTPESFPTPSG
ncbi:DUF4142 domain-containing protein [Nonomuraea sp. NPDC049480]|uniref:DUF4142 domain-containing protein n=1 Tax=Nonomuraea sp. NPDC049480 TaxID=3364353 RepID=UPI0037A2E891